MYRSVQPCAPPILCRAVADTDDEPGPTGPTPEPWPVARPRPERRTRPSKRRRSAPNRLPVPPEAADDPGAGEMIRAWVAGRGLYLSLYVGPETAPWDALLAAAVRRIADALGGDDAADTDDTSERPPDVRILTHTRGPRRPRIAAETQGGGRGA